MPCDVLARNSEESREAATDRFSQIESDPLCMVLITEPRLNRIILAIPAKIKNDKRACLGFKVSQHRIVSIKTINTKVRERRPSANPNDRAIARDAIMRLVLLVDLANNETLMRTIKKTKAFIAAISQRSKLLSAPRK